MLRPAPVIAREDVNGTFAAAVVVCAHAEGVAVAVQADGVTEQQIGRGRPGLDVSLLRPGVAAVGEDKHRSGLRCTRVLLVAVDAGGIARIAGLGDSERASVTAEGDREAELVADIRPAGV